MLLGGALDGGLVILLSFAGLHLHGLLNDPIGEIIEVGSQGALQFLEFRPESVIDEAAVQTGHHGAAPLAAVAVGFDAIATHQGHKQMA